MSSIPLIFLLLFIQDAFTRFSFCHAASRRTYENQCVDLNSQGSGEVRLKPRGAEETKTTIEMSPQGQARFLSLLAATNYLADGANYESKRKVADLGFKRLVIDMPAGRREAVFNFSTIKEVNDLATFFDALINQETLVADINTAMQFDRLSMPKRLEQLENELRANRIGDPRRLIPLLEKIEGDARVVNFARTHAGRLKQQIAAPVSK